MLHHVVLFLAATGAGASSADLMNFDSPDSDSDDDISTRIKRSFYRYRN
jgi:hypothetical protein